MKTFKLMFALCSIVIGGCSQETARPPWRRVLERTIPEFGHRNWIVVADSAYPKQNADGIETVVTGKGQLAVLETVLEQLDDAAHVYPVILLDMELEHVPEQAAPGVTAYRKKLDELLQQRQVRVMPHEEIIAKLDESSEMFNVLLLKTEMTVPYTSVFMQLDCGYWGPEKEQKLREKYPLGKKAPGRATFNRFLHQDLCLEKTGIFNRKQ